MTCVSISIDVLRCAVVLEKNITRGCQAYPTEDDDFQLNDGEEMIAGIASMMCATSQCNFLDSDNLTLGSDQMEDGSSSELI